MLRSDDTGKHVLGVQDLLQKHLLMESQLSALGTRIRNLNKRAQPYMKSLQPETQLLQKQLEPLNKDYEKSVLASLVFRSGTDLISLFITILFNFTDYCKVPL